MEIWHCGSDLACETGPAGFLLRPARAECPTLSTLIVRVQLNKGSSTCIIAAKESPGKKESWRRWTEGVILDGSVISTIMTGKHEFAFKPLGLQGNALKDLYAVALSQDKKYSLIVYIDSSVERARIVKNMIDTFLSEEPNFSQQNYFETEATTSR